MAHDVFISYSSKDKSVADGICAKIENNKIRCWIAPRDVLVGQAYAQSIVKAIDECKVLILVLSADADASPHVLRELDQAVNKRKSIISFRIDNVPLSDTMEYYVKSQHWLDAISPPYEDHIGRLVEVVMAHLNMIHPDERIHVKKNPTCIICGATSTSNRNWVSLIRCKNCRQVLLSRIFISKYIRVALALLVLISVIKIGLDWKIGQDIEAFDRYVQFKEETHIHITEIASHINRIIEKSSDKRLNSSELADECSNLLINTRQVYKEVDRVSYWSNLDIYRKTILELLALEIVRIEALHNGLLAGGQPEDYLPCFGRGITAAYDFDSLNGVFKHDYQKYRHSARSIF